MCCCSCFGWFWGTISLMNRVGDTVAAVKDTNEVLLTTDMYIENGGNSVQVDNGYSCEQCGQTLASLACVIWTCTNTGSYWFQIFSSLSDILEGSLEPNPIMAISGLKDQNAQQLFYSIIMWPDIT